MTWCRDAGFQLARCCLHLARKMIRPVGDKGVRPLDRQLSEAAAPGRVRIAKVLIGERPSCRPPAGTDADAGRSLQRRPRDALLHNPATAANEVGARDLSAQHPVDVVIPDGDILDYLTRGRTSVHIDLLETQTTAGEADDMRLVNIRPGPDSLAPFIRAPIRGGQPAHDSVGVRCNPQFAHSSAWHPRE